VLGRIVVVVRQTFGSAAAHAKGFAGFVKLQRCADYSHRDLLLQHFSETDHGGGRLRN